MELDGWPKVVPERFKDEDLRTYATRAEMIREIVDGFRMGRFRGEVAERKEHELVRLQEFGLERLTA